MLDKICPVCGKPVKYKQYTHCSRECAGLARQNYKECVVCGDLFKSPPSASTKTCRKPDCIKQHRLTVSHYPQVMQSINRGREQLAKTPQGQPGYEFHSAKSWVIQSPDGKIHECRNLLHWLREHEDMIDGTYKQAWDGIAKIKYSAQGKRKLKSYQWKGWRLISWSDE